MNFYGKSLNFKMLTQFVFKHAIDEPKKLKKKRPTKLSVGCLGS